MKAILKHWGVVALGFAIGSLWGLIVASGPDGVRSFLRGKGSPSPPPVPWCIHAESHDLQVVHESPDELLLVDGPRSFFVPTSIFDPETGDRDWRDWGMGYAPYRRVRPSSQRPGKYGYFPPPRELGDPPEAQ